MSQRIQGWARRLGLAVLVLGGVAGTAAAAQGAAPFPGAVQVDGGWVPCDHPIAIAADKGCGAPTPAPPAAAPCNPYNYAVPGGTCGDVPAPPRVDSGKRFVLGRYYGTPYASAFRIAGTLVLSSSAPVWIGECLGEALSECPRGALWQFPINYDVAPKFRELTDAEVASLP